MSSFSDLSALEIKKIKEHAQRLEFENDQLVFSEGDKADSFYIIETGYISIYIERGETTEILTVLETGDYFGEMAIFNNELRFASARSLGRTVLLALDKDAFLEFVKTQPILSEKINALFSERNKLLLARKQELKSSS